MHNSKPEHSKQERCLRYLKKAYDLMPENYGDYIDTGTSHEALEMVIYSVETDRYKEWDKHA